MYAFARELARSDFAREEMMKAAISCLFIALSVIASASMAGAHSGGTDKNGCHHDNKNGGSHCH
jgi:hypothetical protein